MGRRVTRGGKCSLWLVRAAISFFFLLLPAVSFAQDKTFYLDRLFMAGAPDDATVEVENIRRITSPYRPSQDAEGGVEFLPKPYFELEGDKLVRHHDPVPREPVTARELESNDAVDRGGRFPALRRLVRSVGLQGVVQQLIRYQPTPEYDSPSDPAWRIDTGAALYTFVVIYLS